MPTASGDALKVGIGTGLNMACYDKSKVIRLVGIDPATQMNSLAKKRSKQAGLPVAFVAASAEDLPFSNVSFDSLVCTYSLSSIPNPLQTLREMKRGLRPTGSWFCRALSLAGDTTMTQRP